MTPAIVLTTVGSDFDAAALARELVSLGLVACVNIVKPIQSVYRWKESIETEVEQMLVIKTVQERIPELRDALLSRHPYDVPEFVVLAVDGIEGPYREWLIQSVVAPGSDEPSR